MTDFKRFAFYFSNLGRYTTIKAFILDSFFILIYFRASKWKTYLCSENTLLSPQLFLTKPFKNYCLVYFLGIEEIKHSPFIIFRRFSQHGAVLSIQLNKSDVSTSILQSVSSWLQPSWWNKNIVTPGQNKRWATFNKFWYLLHQFIWHIVHLSKRINQKSTRIYDISQQWTYGFIPDRRFWIA